MSRSKRVSEPVQVYLSSAEAARLNRLMKKFSASKSEVLRRGLEALELQVGDPDSHPALRIVGLADGEIEGVGSGDAARDHDRLLAESEVDSWSDRGGRD